MRRCAKLVALLSLAACDVPAQVDRGESDLYVQVYVERDDSAGMGAADTPLRASVTLQGNQTTVERVDSTGADGLVIFEALPPDAYLMSHEPSALPDGLERVGSYRQTVVAPTAGDSVLTRFVYRDTTVVAPPAATD